MDESTILIDVKPHRGCSSDLKRWETLCVRVPDLLKDVFGMLKTVVSDDRFELNLTLVCVGCVHSSRFAIDDRLLIALGFVITGRTPHAYFVYNKLN